MDNNNEYIPYGEEWVKEMMKFPKPLLIEKLSAALQSVTLVEEKEPEAIEFADFIGKDYWYNRQNKVWYSSESGYSNRITTQALYKLF